jgi:hypothetical protein
MWFWPVNEMIELVSGMPAPQFGDESSWVRGSELLQGLSGSVTCFRVPQVQDHWLAIKIASPITLVSVGHAVSGQPCVTKQIPAKEKLFPPHAANTRHSTSVTTSHNKVPHCVTTHPDRCVENVVKHYCSVFSRLWCIFTITQCFQNVFWSLTLVRHDTSSVVFCVLCLIVVPLPPGKSPFAVQLNNNNNNNNNFSNFDPKATRKRSG